MAVTPAAAASPTQAALRRVTARRSVWLAGLVLALVVLSSLAAPLWAEHVAATGPLTNHLTDYIEVDGEQVPVVAFDGVPIGPTWQGEFFLGADGNGRDVMVRLLYGGRTSLMIGVAATLLCLAFGVALGLLAGYYRGWVDSVIARGLDVLWAFPVIILGIALGVALALGGVDLGFVTIQGDSIWLTAGIIGLLNVVYVARPVRGAVLGLRERPFVEAARAEGAGDLRIVRREILPNLVPLLLALGPVILVQAIAIEAALSFLGAGVRQPQPSWGTMIASGLDQLISAPHLTLVPGAVLVATVLALTVIGDVVRDVLDPRGMPAAPGVKERRR